MSFFYKQDYTYDKQPKDGDPKMVNVVAVGVTAGLTIMVLWMAVMPRYTVWQQGLAGQAELRRAEQNRQIKVQEAQAQKDSAALLAEAEVIRAEGVAKANTVVAEGLGGAEGYLRYLYIDMLRDQQGTQTVYIPTEAGLPILEAGKRQ